MTPYPTTSLIISTYNWPQALELSLKSLLRQTVLPTEVIVADDGSKEETRKLIETLKKDYPCPLIHVWHEDTGFRLAAIRNKAIAKASGEYIIQSDGDIIFEKKFIQDHLSFARKGCFVSGSRVNLKPDFSNKLLETKQISISIFTNGIKNKLNGIRCKALTNYFRFRYKKNNPYYVKGCNMAFWQQDLMTVNGYNEDMTGWGREDSELAVRLIMSGIKRQFLKFGGITFHIYHPFNDRERESINVKMMEDAIKNKTKYCKNGLNKYFDDSSRDHK